MDAGEDVEARVTDNEKALLEAVLRDISFNECDWAKPIVELAHKVWNERVTPELLRKVADAEEAHREASKAFRSRIRELELEYSKDAVEVASMRARSM